MATIFRVGGGGRRPPFRVTQRRRRCGRVSAMRAITAVPGQRGSVGVEEVPEPAEGGRCAAGPRAPDGRVRHGPRDRRGRIRRAAARREQADHRPRGSWARCSRRRPARAFVPGIWWSGSCAVPIRFRARRAPPASGTCAATTGSPSAGSSAATDTAASSGASSRTSRWRSPAGSGELGVLLEPTSVLAKAWDQVDRISQRAFFLRGRALVTGAGPIGLLACLLGVQRGYEVHVVDLATEGPKRDLVEALGAHYHAGDAADRRRRRGRRDRVHRAGRGRTFGRPAGWSAAGSCA